MDHVLSCVRDSRRQWESTTGSSDRTCWLNRKSNGPTSALPWLGSCLNGFRVDPYILIENLNTIVGAGDVSYGG